MFKNFIIITICRSCFEFSAILKKYDDTCCTRSCMKCGSHTIIDNRLLVCEGV